MTSPKREPAMTAITNEPLLTVAEAAALLPRTTVDSIRNWLRRGVPTQDGRKPLPCLRAGRRILIRREVVEELRDQFLRTGR